MRYPERVNRKHVQKKKSVKICFSKPEDNEKTGVEGDDVEKPVQTASELVKEKACGSLKTQRFEDVVCQLAQLCLVHVNERNSERHLVFLSLLLRSFHTQRVFSVSHIWRLPIEVCFCVIYRFCKPHHFVFCKGWFCGKDCIWKWIHSVYKCVVFIRNGWQ